MCVGAGGNDGTVRLSDVIPDDPDGNPIVHCVVFNMMIDWPFLLDEIPALRRLTGEQLTVIYGEGSLYGAPPPASLLYVPPLPPYGSHHSKGFLVWRQSLTTGRLSLRVVVTTANFIHSDVCAKSNGLCTFLVPDFEEGGSSAASSSSTQVVCKVVSRCVLSK